MIPNKIYTKLLTIGILLGSFLISCTSQDKHHNIFNYYYYNNTGKNLEVKQWKSGILRTISIKKESNVKITFQSPEGDIRLNDATTDIYPFTMTDSLEIIFEDNKKYKLLRADTRDINILNNNNYTSRKYEKVEDLSYTFTDKDYQAAQ